MRTFQLNKLVRDGIIERMEADGQQVVSRHLDDTEFLREAGRKILEESHEFDPDKPEITELIDIIQAAETTALAMGISRQELEKLKAQRTTERGGFEARDYIETVTVAETDKWADYYAADPTRFKEIL